MGYTDAQIEKHREMQETLGGIRQTSSQHQSATSIGADLVEQTGVPEDIWREAGQEMLEAVLPTETETETKIYLV